MAPRQCSTPSSVVVYNRSIYIDGILHNTSACSAIATVVFNNATIENGSIIYSIFPNLVKSHPYPYTPSAQNVSAYTDLVVSRNNTSVRFGERYDYSIRGDVVTNRGTPSFNLQGDMLGVCYTEDGCITVYTSRDDQTNEAAGITIIAPNFIDPQYDQEVFEYVLELSEEDRIAYNAVKITNRKYSGGEQRIDNVHVKGDIIVNYYVLLDHTVLDTTAEWFTHGATNVGGSSVSATWFQPPTPMPVLSCEDIQEQRNFCRDVVCTNDIVVSRGYSSVLIRENGDVIAVGVVAVLLLPYHGRLKTVVVFQ